MRHFLHSLMFSWDGKRGTWAACVGPVRRYLRPTVTYLD